MNNLDYTFQRIHETAKKLAAITASPELGCITYLQAVGELMDELDTLRTVQRSPSVVSGRSE